MASYHLSVKAINRKDGRSAVAAAAYRAGAKLTNEQDGQTHDFSRRHGVINQFLIVPDSAPEWAHDRASLWNQAEQKERRKDSKTAREFEVALPHEIGDAAREALAREFCQRFQEQFRTVCDVAIHCPPGSKNYHAHILTPTRLIGLDGFGEKIRVLDTADTSGAIVEQLRADFATMTNKALEAHQVADRVDHRSYARRGLDAVPGRHLGPVRTAIRRREAAMERAARVARHVAARLRLGPHKGRPAAPVAGQSYGWARRSINAARQALAVPQAPRFTPALTVAAMPAVAPPSPVLVAPVPTQAPPPMPLAVPKTPMTSNLMASLRKHLPPPRPEPVFRPMPSFRPTVLPAAQPWQQDSDDIDYSPS